jgi:hypothetical protein
MIKVVLPRMFYAVLSFSLIYLTGCTTVDFKQPVSSYNQTMALSGAVLSTYYSEVNNQARTVYLHQARYDNNFRIADTGSDGSKTPLLAMIPPEAIKVRLDSINLINQYGTKLAQLAGSDAPELVNASFVSIGTTFTTLSQRFKDSPELGGKNKNIQYIQPISTIVGVLSEQYMDAKRDDLLRNAVKQGYPAVDEVLKLLEGDIPLLHQWATGNAEDELRRSVVYYNNNKAKMSYEQRTAILNQIDDYGKTYQELTINQPTDVVAAMRQANKALVNYADNPKDENRVARLTAEIETFNARVTPIAQAILKIRNIY